MEKEVGKILSTYEYNQFKRIKGRRIKRIIKWRFN